MLWQQRWPTVSWAIRESWSADRGKRLSSEHLLRKLGLLSLEKRWLQGNPTADPSGYMEGVEETDPGTSQWCLLGGEVKL